MKKSAIDLAVYRPPENESPEPSVTVREITLDALRTERVILTTPDPRGISEIEVERLLRMLWGGEL